MSRNTKIRITLSIVLIIVSLCMFTTSMVGIELPKVVSTIALVIEAICSVGMLVLAIKEK
ncbi:MAG: hypothetical protein IJG56_04465 [Clostridia bacterium]|nr:hypothetical protein [Clostridia bacterium]MBQ4464831.1 hypothetical protein [Oscillospiraceae bacterium]